MKDNQEVETQLIFNFDNGRSESILKLKEHVSVFNNKCTHC